MSADTVKRRVVERITRMLENAGAEVPATPEGIEALSVLGFDSLKVVELLFEMEVEFAIEIPEQELGSLDTVSSLVSAIQRSLLAKSNTQTCA